LKSAPPPLPRAWRLGFLYATVFLVGGCYLPYLPVWLHWRELTPIRGPLYRIFTGEAYVAMALLALLGAGSAFLLMRRWHGGLVVAGHHPHSSDVGGAIIPPS
jgi:hypothetical protein